MDIDQIYTELLILVNKNRTQEATTKTISILDDLISENNFESIDNFIYKLTYNKLTLTIDLSVLALTRFIKKDLSYRSEFLSIIEDELKSYYNKAMVEYLLGNRR